MSIEGYLNYKFQNESLLQQALTHSSYGSPNNERLEFLGDAVLSLIITNHLYHKFPKVSEGDLTKTRAKIVKGETVAIVGQELHLSRFLKLGASERKSGGVNKSSIVADCMEAIIGAIFLDGGIVIVSKLVLEWFATKIDAVDIKQLKDAKTLLQEYLQKLKQPLPVYSLIGTAGSDHHPVFTVCCALDAFSLHTEAHDETIKRAEQKSADMMLQLLRVKKNV